MTSPTISRTTSTTTMSPHAYDIGLLVLRLTLGLTMVAHGGQKLFGWFGGGGVDGTAQLFTSVGYPSGKTMAVVAGLTETLGGLGLVLGLLPGTDPAALSRFAEDRWNVDPAVFEEHAKARSLNFATIPRPLRQDAKYYIWQLINHPSPGTMRHSGGGDRPAIATILTVFSSFKEFLSWLHRHGVTAFDQVTPALLDEYLVDVDDEPISMVRKYRRIGEVRRLWLARGILPPRMRLPAVPPWGGQESRDLFGRLRVDRDNRTPRISELTMQHLLIWAIRFTEDFADDIVAARAEYEGSRLRQLAGATRSPVKIRTRIARLSGPAARARRHTARTGRPRRHTGDQLAAHRQDPGLHGIGAAHGQ